MNCRSVDCEYRFILYRVVEFSLFFIQFSIGFHNDIYGLLLFRIDFPRPNSNWMYSTRNQNVSYLNNVRNFKGFWLLFLQSACVSLINRCPFQFTSFGIQVIDTFITIGIIERCAMNEKLSNFVSTVLNFDLNLIDDGVSTNLNR